MGMLNMKKLLLILLMVLPFAVQAAEVYQVRFAWELAPAGTMPSGKPIPVAELHIVRCGGLVVASPSMSDDLPTQALVTFNSPQTLDCYVVAALNNGSESAPAQFPAVILKPLPDGAPGTPINIEVIVTTVTYKP